MTREEILTKLKDIMRYTLKNAEQILPDVSENSNLYTDLGLTSVGMLYSVIAMEEMFGISFDGVEFKQFATMGDVVDYIELKSV